MRYAISRLEYEYNEIAYRIYISDSIYYYAQGKGLGKRYADFVNHAFEDDPRNGDEIVKDIMQRGGLRFSE